MIRTYQDLLLKNGLKSMTNQKKITIRIKTSMPRSNLWDCSGAYITVKGNITVTDPDKA